jgi:Domain of unknown function (DUF4193)
MNIDYDAPRVDEVEELGDESLAGLAAQRNQAQLEVADADEPDVVESFELPGDDLSGLELAVRVIPKQADEFTCSVCFLVHHRSQLASAHGDRLVCVECAS